MKFLYLIPALSAIALATPAPFYEQSNCKSRTLKQIVSDLKRHDGCGFCSDWLRSHKAVSTTMWETKTITGPPRAAPLRARPRPR